jgi:hypothetical protein
MMCHRSGSGALVDWSQEPADGARNPFYESMREVAPGDLIFSFVDTRITAPLFSVFVIAQ